MLELAAVLWILGQCAAGLGFLIGLVLLVVFAIRGRRRHPAPPTHLPPRNHLANVESFRPKRPRARRLG